MLVAFGLGNPDDSYRGTRHNIGKEVVGDLAGRLGLRLRPGRGDFFGAVDPEKGLHLVVPTTYVNIAGIAASQVLSVLGVSPKDVLVVCDDFNLPLGSLRIRKSGSEGGHNGLASVIYHLGTTDFPRLRLGVGPLPPDTDPADFVLSRFGENELETVSRLKAQAVRAVLDTAASGLDAAMNTYNRRVAPSEDGC